MNRRLPLLAALFLLAGCDASDGGGSALCGGTTGRGSLTATVPAGTFTAKCFSGTFSSGVLAIGGNLGASASGGVMQEQITLAVPGAQAGQTYTVGSGVTGVYTRLETSNPANANAVYTSTSGSVRVDAVSVTGAKGTFSFTGRNNAGATISVSSGTFDLTF